MATVSKARKRAPARKRTKADRPTIALEYIDPMLLRPHPKNAKVHTDKQIEDIVKSMDDTEGSVQPILIDEENTILAGHGRWMAHKKRGDIDCPVVRKVGLTEEQKLRFLVADNQLNAMTGYHDDVMAEVLAELRAAEIDISRLGFGEKELDKLLNYEEEAEKDRDLIDEAGTESWTVSTLAEEIPGDMLDVIGKYQLPVLDESKIPELDPKGYTVWMNRHRTMDEGRSFFHMFGRESTKGLDPTRTLIGFYIDDSRFERIWTQRRENTQRFINAGVSSLVMPDFTRQGGWPLPRNLWQVYRNFYTAAYWQQAGLMVVPNLSCWDRLSVEDCLEPIPRGCASLACQLQTQFGGRNLKSGDWTMGRGATEEDARHNVTTALEIVRPKSLLVYAGQPGLRLGEQICKRMGVKFIGVENRATAATSSLANDTGRF